MVDKPLFSFISIENQDQHEETMLILKEIEERNSTIEKTTNWLNQAYRNFLIKELVDLDDQSYGKYREYLDGGSLYIIVHPAYYTFFEGGPLISYDIPKLNAVEEFLHRKPFNEKTKVMQAQERMMLDFLEYTSTRKRLMILILPGDYPDASSYRYAKGSDELMRYINEATNESDSVIYIYSKRSFKGGLSGADNRRLAKFLAAVKPERILLGGGYMGRCVDDFYRDLITSFNRENIFLVPELTAWAPSDLTPEDVTGLLSLDGTLNKEKLTIAVEKRQHNAQKASLLIRNLANGAIYH